MSKAKAPGGAFTAATHQPAIELKRPSQGTNEPLDASPTKISRMLRSVFENEKTLRAWEDMAKSKGRRMALVDGVAKFVPVSTLIGDSVERSRKDRDEHLKELRHVIDYALTTDAYEDVPCPVCRLPSDAMDFIQAVPTFEPPAIMCQRCKGRGFVRAKKTSKKAKSAFKRVSYFKRVLDDTIACAKIRMGTSGAREAYETLENANRGLLSKFSNGTKTELEAPDAEQGVRQGIVDAAFRFDPSRKEGAAFSTVAYNWCYRNSRARQDGHKRAGVYAPSIEGMKIGNVAKGELVDPMSLVVDGDGAFGSFSPTGPDNTLTLDLREKVAGLPADQRSVIQCELAGRSTKEISSQLEMTAVKVRRLRGLAYESLRSSMTGYVEAISD